MEKLVKFCCIRKKYNMNATAFHARQGRENQTCQGNHERTCSCAIRLKSFAAIFYT